MCPGGEAVPILFAPGTTTVFMRIETPDPMVLPVHLADSGQAQHRQMLEAYS